MPRYADKRDLISTPLLVMFAFLVLAFLLGGGSRADIQSLVILRPLAVLALGYGASRLDRSALGAHRFLIAMASASFLLVIAQLIPLPPGLWSRLPGRELVAAVDAAASHGPIWRPISLVPAGTWNALYALVPPLAALALGLSLTPVQLRSLLPLMILLGLASGFLGLLQAAGPDDSALYFFRVTNNGAAVGLFANRNHQAVLLACLFPMLAVYASTDLRSPAQARLRSWLAIGAAVVLVPLLLVTGSRSGLVAGVIGLASVPFLYRPPVPPSGAKKRSLQFLLAALAISGLGLLAILMTRAEALERLLGQDPGGDTRMVSWGPVAEMATRYFPFGSGFGSFVEVYQVHEPHALLRLDYFNHAHNDWLELALTGGLPAMLLLAVAVVAFVVRAIRLFRSSRRGQDALSLSRLGMVIIAILALASISDYPLRTPAMACLFVIALLWSGQSEGGHARE